MIRVVLLSLGIVFTGFAVHAQSTLTLDDFSLNDDQKPASDTGQKTISALESCLIDTANCKDKKLKSSTAFSIDDVVNLGIIDREEVKPQTASTSGTSQTVMSQTLPSIDMEILFDYDSDTIRPDQFQKLFELSNVLKGSKFDNFKFAFLGHSDAKGEVEYNRTLSFRRASAVSRFIVSAAGVEQDRVVSSGMGASKLKTPADPFGSANRRVQLILIPVN